MLISDQGYLLHYMVEHGRKSGIEEMFSTTTITAKEKNRFGNKDCLRLGTHVILKLLLCKLGSSTLRAIVCTMRLNSAKQLN